ncbi:MAG: peptidylprolyl isomerase [Prevotellaceae bacterium]|jgi:FKBP-type peptidyl-prolyl cis-trans isomerase SlyD|nr:peptidylprolyl isomerase [Prevotellaceae bacterium]
MKIEKDKVVSLSYVLTVDGETIETVTPEKPMKFIMGTGYLLPRFEENIFGKQAGDTFEFTLAAADAYGETLPEAIVELPASLFEVEGKLEAGLLTAGNVLPMTDSDGNRLNGVIDEVRKDTVVMNFNHPLAGEELYFKGTVVAVREATAEELLHGLYGEKNAGCGCGGCSCDAEDCSTCR